MSLLRLRKSILIAIFILLSVLYIIYESSLLWPISQSVPSVVESHPKHTNLYKEFAHISLQNLIHRPILINTSRVNTISAKELTHILQNHNLSQIKKPNNQILHTNETQTERKNRVEYFCEKYGLKHKIVSIWRHSSNNFNGKHKYCTTKNCPVLVDQKHKFMSCFVQKIASTSMKTIFNILNDNPLNISVNTNVTAFHFTANDVLPRISPMFYNTNQNKMFFKALFVRHPFFRLVSAFKDKAEKNRSEEPYFYAKYWDNIMRSERGEQNVNNNSMPMFKEFVKHLLITSPYKYDEHWAPVWTRCEPCYVGYDFIGKLETSSQDFRFIANKLSLNQTIWENKNSVHINKHEVKKYLLQITAEDIIALYRIYFLDFKLFGYTIEEIFK